MKPSRSLAVILALALMAGCSAIQPAPDEAQVVAGMLAAYERLASSKIDEQRREFGAAQAAHDRAANDTTRLNLALLMLLPRAPWRDDARIQLLLGGIEAAPGSQRSARHDLAQLLLKQVAERQRTQRDEQRKTEQLAHQLREEKRKNEEMQQKIESLRTIDRETYKRKKTP
jgi:outer membrane murein-binding lipoprotein Lpp